MSEFSDWDWVNYPTSNEPKFRASGQERPVATTGEVLTDKEIHAATAAMPDWLAADIREWVRREEMQGRRFGSALDAMKAALAALGGSE